MAKQCKDCKFAYKVGNALECHATDMRLMIPITAHCGNNRFEQKVSWWKRLFKKGGNK